MLHRVVRSSTYSTYEPYALNHVLLIRYRPVNNKLKRMVPFHTTGKPLARQAL